MQYKAFLRSHIFNKDAPRRMPFLLLHLDSVEFRSFLLPNLEKHIILLLKSSVIIIHCLDTNMKVLQ